MLLFRGLMSNGWLAKGFGEREGGRGFMREIGSVLKIEGRGARLVKKVRSHVWRIIVGGLGRNVPDLELIKALGRGNKEEAEKVVGSVSTVNEVEGERL